MSARIATPGDLEAVGVTPVTPFSSDLRQVDLAGLRANLEYLLDAGVRLLYPAGNTGEVASLSLAEWTAVVETTVEVCGDRAIVLPGITQEHPTALEAARRASSLGAHGLLLMPRDQAYADGHGTARYWADVADTAGLPVVLYKRARPDDGTLVETVQRGEVIGCKYSGRDVALFATAVRSSGRSDIVWTCGLAERYAPFYWPAGARGFTSGLANAAPWLPLAMLAALGKDDLAEASDIREDAVPFEEIRARHGDAYNVAAVKVAMDAVGLAGGRVRPPLRELDDTAAADMRRVAAALVDEWRTP